MSRTTATVSERLLDHCERLSDDIVADYDDGLHSGTPEIVAAFRETFIQEIVSRFFPRSYRTAKGSIFDSYGSRSQSIDCVVCAPNHPLFLDSLGRVTTLLADGVQCAIEVKPDLRDQPGDFGKSRQNKPELVRALEQVRSVKLLRRRHSALFINPGSPERLDHTLRVPAYLFAVEPTPISALCKYVADYYFFHKTPLAEQVDMIAVLGSGVIVNCKYPEHDTRTHILNDPSTWTSGLVAYDCGKSTLAYFILRATVEVGPELTMSTPLLAHYFERDIWPESWRRGVVAYSTTFGKAQSVGQDLLVLTAHLVGTLLKQMGKSQ